MITMEMVEDLAVWLLNYDEEFTTFRGETFLKLTEAGVASIRKMLVFNV